MFCDKCGTKIPENMRFCLNCGKPVNGVNREEQTEKVKINIKNQELTSNKKTKKSKRKRIVIFILILIVILAGTGSYLYFTSPIYNIQKNIKTDNVSPIVEEFNSNVVGSKLQESISVFIISDYINELVNAYEKGEKDYETVHELLSVLAGINSDELVSISEEKMFNLEKYQKNQGIYVEAEKLYKEGQYVDAITQYELITEDSEVYETAQERINECKKKYKEDILAQTESPSTLEDYEECLDLLSETQNILPDDEDISKRQEDINEGYLSVLKTTALENAKNAAETGNYSKVFSELESAIKKLPDDNDLINQKSSYESQYIESVLASVNSSMEAKEYNQAQTTVRNALKILPGNEILRQKSQEIEAAKPVLLSSLTAVNGGFEWNQGTPVDSFGNTYNNASNYTILNAGRDYYAKEYYAEYRIYKNYTTFNFSVAPCEEIPENGSGQVQVYVDDKLTFTSDVVYRKSDKKDYSVDVSNAEYIKIVINADKGEGDFWSDNLKDCILLLDCTLEK